MPFEGFSNNTTGIYPPPFKITHKYFATRSNLCTFAAILFFNLASMKKIFVCSLAFLLGSSGAMAQSVSDRVKLNEKESVGMTLSRFSPIKSKSKDANALLRYPMLRLVRQDEPTKPSIPYAERTFTERKAQHGQHHACRSRARALGKRHLQQCVGILRLQRNLYFRLQC